MAYQYKCLVEAHKARTQMFEEWLYQEIYVSANELRNEGFITTEAIQFHIGQNLLQELGQADYDNFVSPRIVGAAINGAPVMGTIKIIQPT